MWISSVVIEPLAVLGPLRKLPTCHHKPTVSLEKRCDKASHIAPQDVRNLVHEHTNIDPHCHELLANLVKKNCLPKGGFQQNSSYLFSTVWYVFNVAQNAYLNHL